MDITQLLGPAPEVKIQPLEPSTVDPRDIWINYDEDLDTLILYLSSQHTDGIFQYVNGFYVVVDPETHRLLGYQFEGWEDEFVPNHEELLEVWPTVKQSLRAREGWSQLLRLFGPWLILLLNYLEKHSGNSSDFHPVPA